MVSINLGLNRDKILGKHLSQAFNNKHPLLILNSSRHLPKLLVLPPHQMVPINLGLNRDKILGKHLSQAFNNKHLPKFLGVPLHQMVPINLGLNLHLHKLQEAPNQSNPQKPLNPACSSLKSWLDLKAGNSCRNWKSKCIEPFVRNQDEQQPVPNCKKILTPFLALASSPTSKQCQKIHLWGYG
jgi:hypothetical protein